MSDFLSPRTRDLLAREDISYVDITGNIRLVTQAPPIFIEVAGADRRRADGSSRRSADLTGVKAGRVVRFLAEVLPPYGVGDIEEATGISRGYVSRLLDRLSDEALIRREARGPVEGVDWVPLLERLGQAVDLFKANMARTYLSSNGARAVMESLTDSSAARHVVVTGSFAAVRKAPVSGPALLVLYVDPRGQAPSRGETAAELGLLPTDEAPDVVLLTPADESIVKNPWVADGVRFVNLPQLVVDCLVSCQVEGSLHSLPVTAAQ